MNKQPCSQDGCPANKVRNPHTGRCITIGGKTYKKVCSESHLSARKKRKKRRKGGQKKGRVKCSQDGCPDNKVRNPRTGRCITIGGKTYRENCEEPFPGAASPSPPAAPAPAGGEEPFPDPFDDAKHEPFPAAAPGPPAGECETKTHSSDCIQYSPLLDYVVLPANSIIYRGTREAKIDGSFEVNYKFFGSYDLAEVYAEGGGEIHGYRTKKSLKLLDMNSFSNIENLYGLANRRGDRDLISLYFMNRDRIEEVNRDEVIFKDGRSVALDGTSCEVPEYGFDRSICTEGFVTENDRANEMYISRKMLAWICRTTNLDGWIHFGIMARSHAQPSAFHDEIGICHPSTDLQALAPQPSQQPSSSIFDRPSGYSVFGPQP